MLTPLPVAPLLVAKKAQGLLDLSSDYELATKWCVPARGIVGFLRNSPFYILVTNTLSRPQKVYKRKVLGRLTDDIYNIINKYLKISIDESSALRVSNTVITEESS